ncbi:Lrp/AsnC family transcriptional regulator [Pelagibius litoralis]|uniref:siroheme decarboxylase n=1 Tax=Pelagibius litoralis TaxID=374515 RepID=A0A967EYJ3_9PROT|nr:AsnC family transcriptional regulator [Pelagibius litoralis]NIA69695.1 Lrp/AsnC family transcriptional regulator [Pelagibius litoralis]
MSPILDPIDHALLDGWQRDFPLVSRPFAVIGQQLDLSEDQVLDRLRRLSGAGAISRIGATCRPNTAGASTLAAVAAPDFQIDEVASIIGAEPGVNHSYLRENRWNVWFVVTGPDRAHVDATLSRIQERTGLEILDLPLLRPFNVNLGFSLDGTSRLPTTRDSVDAGVLLPEDRPIMQALSNGLPLVARPYADLSTALGRTEVEILSRIAVLAEAGILSRIGVIVRHRALGWRSNAMVVWELPEAEVERVGPALTAVRGVTLCYQRRPVPGVWPYTLYCMIHARTRAEAMAVLDRACEEVGLAEVPHQVLFSIRCFKQTGALVVSPNGAAA